MRGKILSLAGITFLFLVSAGVKSCDPCKLITCQPGYHCVDGKCVQDQITCDQFICPEGSHCEVVNNAPTCVQDPSCAGYNCQTGYHCEMVNGKPTCVSDPITDPCDGVTCSTGTHCEKGICVPDNPTSCPSPIPPHIFTVAVKIHQANCANIDTTPKVKNDAEHPNYCASVGYYDQNPCPVRLESDPNRFACEQLALGGAETWRCEGGCQIWPCSVKDNCVCGPDQYHNNNPAQAIVTGKGTVYACDAAGKVCGSLVVQ